MSGGDFDALEAHLEQLLAAIAPDRRQMLAGRMMEILRKANVRRIAANVTPEGDAMPPRKKREGTRSGRVKKGKMFKRIGRQLKTRVTGDMGELTIGNALVRKTAEEHHFGLEGFVGKTRAGRTIRTKYQARTLLGFGEEREQFMELLVQHLDV